MPEPFLLTVYSFLFIVSGGFLAISLARLTRVHPAYFFLLFGGVLAVALRFVLPQRSLLTELAELGAIFVIFLAALETEWDARFSWRATDLFTALLLQAAIAVPITLMLRFWLALDTGAAIFGGLIAAVHSPERKRAVVGDSFRHNVIAGEAGFFGFVSEITLLIALGLLGAYAQRETLTADLLQVAVGILLILILLITFVPQALRLLLRRVSEESYALFYLMLALFVAVTLVVRKAGIEPLVGAYAAGFVMARFVTEGSKVKERLRFTGHSLLVPSFYIMFGLTVALTGSMTAQNFFFAGALLLITFIMRTASFFALKQGRSERAVSLVQLMRKNPLVLVLLYIATARGVFPVTALHPVLLYLIANELCVVLLALRAPEGDGQTAPQAPESRVLLPVSNPETMLPLMNLASHLGSSGRAPRIHPLNVVADLPGAEAKIRAVEMQFNEIIPLYAARDQTVQLSTRIDNDRIRAVARASRELIADRILLGLGVIPTLQRPQGYSFLESLTQEALQTTILAAHLQSDLALTSTVNVIVAKATLLETIDTWLPLVTELSRRLRAEAVFFSDPVVLAEIDQILKAERVKVSYSLRTGQIHAGLDLVTLDASPNAFSVAVLERSQLHPNEKIHARLPEMMLRAFADRNFMLVYPACGSGALTQRRLSSWKKFKRILGFR